MKRAKILALSILTLFILSLFLSAVYAANDTNKINNPFLNTVGNSQFFTDWQQGKLDLDVAKIMFFILIAIVILAIADQVPIFQDNRTHKAKWYTWPVALIGAYLGTAYLAPEEIFVMLSSWGALGVTLGVALPFVLLAYFTFSLSTDTTASAPRMLRDEALAYVIWILFGLVLLYRLVTVYTSTNPEIHKYVTGWSMWLIWILMIGTALIIMWIPKIFSFFRTKETEAEIDKDRQVSAESAAKVNSDAERLKIAAGALQAGELLADAGA